MYKDLLQHFGICIPKKVASEPSMGPRLDGS